MILISNSQAWVLGYHHQRCDKTIYKKPDTFCQARYTYIKKHICHLQPSYRKVPFIEVEPSQTRASVKCPIPYLPFDHTLHQHSATVTVATSSHIKKAPCLTNPASFCLNSAPSPPEASTGSCAVWDERLLRSRLQQLHEEASHNWSAKPFCVDLFTSWLG